MKPSKPVSMDTAVADDPRVVTVSRRTCLLGAAAIAGAGTVLGPKGFAAQEPGKSAAPTLLAGRDKALVATAAGKVRGYIRSGIHTFKGIPYGDSTAGVNRFMPPVKPKPWAGIRSCLAYGPVSPQPLRLDWQNDEANFLVPQDDGIPDEDCLRVNVWSPTLGTQAKLPVMLWLHGGRYTTGSSQHLLAYDGENLARRGEVVVVSLNHRLGVLGFMDLSQYDSQFEASGNVGMLDIVAALQWVRDNIAAFGGDPGRVTVFGHSGGAGKVVVLTAMPGARGLFHRAIAQSGPVLKVRAPEGSRQLAEEALRELRLDGSRLEALQRLPYTQLVAAGGAVVARHRGPLFSADLSLLRDTVGWAPVVDGKILAAHPSDPGVASISAHVPMMIGTTLNEAAANIGQPDGDEMSEAELLNKVKNAYPERAPKVIAAFRQRTPQASPFDLWSRIATAPVRGVALEQCRRRAAMNQAPVWSYWFTWQTPVLDGRPHAFHGVELPFVFNNATRCDTITGGGPQAQVLSHRMCDAWTRFARNGDPNHDGLPQWPAFKQQRESSMIFDNRCEARDAPDAVELVAAGPFW